jgi:hypothetical protein
MKAYALCSLLFIFLFATLSQAFSFTNGSPGQCDDLKVDWTDGKRYSSSHPHPLVLIIEDQGGQAPFQLLISPVCAQTLITLILVLTVLIAIRHAKKYQHTDERARHFYSPTTCSPNRSNPSTHHVRLDGLRDWWFFCDPHRRIFCQWPKL